MKHYKVYIILCENGSLYTGISVDVDRRFKQHKSGRGAKFFRTSRPERLLWSSVDQSHTEALLTERLLKNFSREGKLKFLRRMGVTLPEVLDKVPPVC